MPSLWADPELRQAVEDILRELLVSPSVRLTTWCCTETTNHSREVIGKALAHLLKDASEAAYQRGDLLTRHAKLMNDWACYCRSLA